VYPAAFPETGKDKYPRSWSCNLRCPYNLRRR